MSERRQAGGERPGCAGTMRGEHDAEIALLEALEDAIARARPRDEITAMLQQLIDHTSAHFMSEQLLMRLYAYPSHDAHAQEHDRLMEQARELEARFAAAGKEVTPELVAGLRRWLLDHMSSQDRALEKYLDKHGPSPDRQARPVAASVGGPAREKG